MSQTWWSVNDSGCEDDYLLTSCAPSLTPMFHRLRPALLDAVAFVVLLAALASGIPWLRTVSLVYAGLVIVLRLGTLVARITPPVSTVPDGVFHALYGASVGAAGVAQDWTLAAMWAVIWAFSLASSRRPSEPTAAAQAAAKAASASGRTVAGPAPKGASGAGPKAKGAAAKSGRVSPPGTRRSV